MRGVIGLGDIVVVFFNGFYIDDLFFVFDLEVMSVFFYYDVG